MLVLGIDTATPIASVGLIREKTILVERSYTVTSSHAENLLPLIAEVLRLAQVSLSEVEGIGVTIGPGAFSGLRIALSTVKGFAYALSQRVVGISTLLALAHCVNGWTGRICVVLDARKREVYSACFERDKAGTVRRLTEDSVLSPRDLLEQAASSCLFIGDGVDRYRDLIQEHCGTRAQLVALADSPPRGSVVARLAWERFRRGEQDDVSQLVPHYIRRSDAERNRGIG